MSTAQNEQPAVGADCEYCGTTEVVRHTRHGRLICDACWAAAVEFDKAPVERAKQVRSGAWLGDWWVVWRWSDRRNHSFGGRYIRVAAFATEHIARGWVAEANCRRRDLVLPFNALPPAEQGGQSPNDPS